MPVQARLLDERWCLRTACGRFAANKKSSSRPSHRKRDLWAHGIRYHLISFGPRGAWWERYRLLKTHDTQYFPHREHALRIAVQTCLGVENIRLGYATERRRRKGVVKSSPAVLSALISFRVVANTL